MIDENTFKEGVDFRGAKGLVFIQDKILIFHRDKNAKYFPLMMDLPGGGKENDESPFQTFKREVMEELGINISESDIMYSQKYPSASKPGLFGYFLVAKPVNVLEKDIVFGNEGLGYSLATPDEFINMGNVAIARLQENTKGYLKAITKSE